MSAPNRRFWNSITLFMLFLFSSPSTAQETTNPFSGTPDHPDYSVEHTTGPIRIDGTVDDPAWQQATLIKLPFEYLPADNVAAPVDTDFLITFDENHLYMAFRCCDPDPSKIRAHLMDRDAMETYIQDDHVTVMIDFFNDERRAFLFQVNPLGVQADAIYSETEAFEDYSWDAIWNSKAKMTEFGWTVEISIPFNQLRFPSNPGVQTWGMSAVRSYPRSVCHLMSSHKRKRDVSSILVQFNKVTGFAGMKTGWNMEVDPTLTINRTDESKDFPSGELEQGKFKSEPGISIRWGITPNMILNAAVNPDFSQVEADVKELEVNRRYAIRYPEKRPFFLEGADFFLTPIEAVFTRTVADPDIGFKFTGKMGRSALGVFGTHDHLNNLLLPSNEGSVPASEDRNVTGGVFRYRHDIGRGSTLGTLYTGRVSDAYYNHLAGIDGFFRLSRTKTVSVQYLSSRTDYSPTVATDFGIEQNGFGGGALSSTFTHQGREWSYNLSYMDFAPGFRADFGYIPRVDFRTGNAGFSRNFWGKQGGWFDLMTLGAYGGATFDYDGIRTDSDVHVYVTYSGPMQTDLLIISARKREVFGNTNYDLTQAMVKLETKPTRGLRLFFMTHFGDMIDYTNHRLAWHMILNPACELNLGRHINVDFRFKSMRMALKGVEIFTADLIQAKLVYNFSVRAFIRAIAQYELISRNPTLYDSPVGSKDRNLLTQFLFSYKLNPQTVVFIGYSDNHLGDSQINMKRSSRTFFVKLGWAWLR